MHKRGVEFGLVFVVSFYNFAYFPLFQNQSIGIFVNLVFLGHAFTIMLVYIWSQRNPYVRMSFFGIMTFRVSSEYDHFPFVIVERFIRCHSMLHAFRLTSHGSYLDNIL